MNYHRLVRVLHDDVLDIIKKKRYIGVGSWRCVLIALIAIYVY